jgi:predicted metalloprotease with PDZ domain
VNLQSTNGRIEQITKNEWLLDGLKVGQEVSISYNVYAYEYGIRTAFLDFTRGYFNPTSII